MIAGRFRVTRQLGQGGMGSVWAAVHETLGREVAVKFLQPQDANNPVLTDRFVSEAHMVASIKHRFVVDVFDFGVTEDGLHYMVLELLHGRSLAERMDRGPALSVRQAVRLMADCLRGLHVVHEADIIHRDLKPDNIIVVDDVDGVFPKLIDFGISRRSDDAVKLNPTTRKGRLTQPGTVLGTPYYMSPEQLRGRNLDGRADLYSVGVILYELLVGALPFQEDNLGDLLIAMTMTAAPRLSEHRPELGEALAAVIARTLAPAPEGRYASALELRDALMQVLPDLPEDAQCVVQLSGRDESSLSDVPRRSFAQISAVQPVVRAWTLSKSLRRSRPLRTALIAGLGLGLSAWAWSSMHGAPPALGSGVAQLGQVQLPTLQPALPNTYESGQPAPAEGAPAPPPKAATAPATARATAASGPVRVSVHDTVIVPARSPRSSNGSASANTPSKSQRVRAPARASGVERPSSVERASSAERSSSAERPGKVFTKLDF